MTYRQLGDSGLTVSTVGLGCNNFGRRLDQDGTNAVVRQALDSGITLFDTADIYGQGASEEMLGARARSRARERRRGNEVRHGHAGRQRARLGCAGLAALRPQGRRGQPAPPRHRLDRPLPAAPTRPADADRARRSRRSTSSSARARCATSAAATSPAGRSSTPTGRRGPPAPSGSSRRRTSTRCSSATSRRSSCPRASTSASGCCRSSRSPPACSPASTAAARRRPRAPASPAMADRLAGADWDTIERLEAYAAERGLRLIDVAIGGLAAQPAVASVIAGATRPEQVVDNVRAGLVGADRRGPRRARRDHDPRRPERARHAVALAHS